MRSTTVDRSGARSTSEAPTHRPLASADVIRQAQEGTALLVYGNLPPSWLRLRPWFSDRRLRGLAASREKGDNAPEDRARA